MGYTSEQNCDATVSLAMVGAVNGFLRILGCWGRRMTTAVVSFGSFCDAACDAAWVAGVLTTN